jgi:4-amino-4-deoxy-L-arabinose transferase-like glycosyltransferase
VTETRPLREGAPVGSAPRQEDGSYPRSIVPSWLVPVVLALVQAAILLRVAAASRPGLWADEIFSLAIATGHSLEHPAAAAVPALGDFAEPRETQLPAVFRRYAEHEERPAGVGRVVRAVRLSDTNPPLYYVLLNGWTRVFGTGDAALRLFSVWWAVLLLPLLWFLGWKVGGPRVAWSACLLFSFSPVALFYSIEGRMYSLLWCLGLSLACLTLRLSSGRVRPWLSTFWVLTGIAGLLTHYFFAFAWLACLMWLWLVARVPPRRLAGLAGVTLIAVLPWYLEVPASLALWRVSGGWLDGDLVWPRALGRPLALAGSLFSSSSLPSGWQQTDYVVAALFLLVAVWIVSQATVRRLLSHRSLLLWGWLAVACLGPLVFDVFRHTTTSEIPRYVVPALPAAMLLAALVISQLPPKLHLAVLGGLLLAWLPGNREGVVKRVPRPWEPYTVLDARLEAWVRPNDLVLVNSIPSGVLGVARYLRPDIPIASWVSQLGTREVPADLEQLLHGHRRVAFVKIHRLDGSDAPEKWLRAHARLLGRETFRRSSAEVLYFGPAQGQTFFPAAPSAE